MVCAVASFNGQPSLRTVGVVAIMAALPTALAALLLDKPWRVRIRKGGLELQFLRSSEMIRFSQIENVGIVEPEVFRFQGGKIVVVSLVGAAPLRLNLYRGGEDLLASSIFNAWKTARGAKALSARLAIPGR